MTTLPRTHALVALAVVMTGCGESTLAPNGAPLSGTEGLEIAIAPTFAEDIQPILDRYGCAGSSCHGAGQGNLFLSSDPVANYSSLVNVRANNEPSFLRVAPGDAQNSYVIMVFENRQSPLYPRMPTDDGLDPIDLTNFRTWIDQGATFN